MMKTEIPVEAIGSIAFETCKHDLHGIVMGNTSKGMFIRFENDTLIFCSREAFHGPLTINFSQPELLPILDEGLVSVNVQQLILGEEYFINTNNPPIWKAPWVDTTMKICPSLDDAQSVGKAAIQDQKSDYPVAMLQNLGRNLSDCLASDPRWKDVCQAIVKHSSDDFFSALAGVVGYGRGLTPSGDDFILGVLLGSSRYRDHPGMDLLLEQHYLDSIEAATNQTTLISRQLIQAAIRGEADERLISAFDGWMFHDLDGKQLYDLLRSWGNSSGLDAFTGWVSFLLMKKLI